MDEHEFFTERLDHADGSTINFIGGEFVLFITRWQSSPFDKLRQCLTVFSQYSTLNAADALCSQRE